MDELRIDWIMSINYIITLNELSYSQHEDDHRGCSHVQIEGLVVSMTWKFSSPTSYATFLFEKAGEFSSSD